MAYSLDLRKRVIAAVRAKQQTIDQIAATFGVSASTVDKWAKRWRERKRIAALPWAGGVKRKLRGCEAAIRAKVKEQPDITLAELGEHLQTTAKVVASPSMLSRELARLNLPRKKRRSTTASGIRRG
ncbi:MAG: IS630 transposase-related protein [Anaerolineales bacterium]